MKRKEEVETMIAAIARKLKGRMEHASNNKTGIPFLEETVIEMQKLTDYIEELKRLR